MGNVKMYSMCLLAGVGLHHLTKFRENRCMRNGAKYRKMLCLVKLRKMESDPGSTAGIG